GIASGANGNPASPVLAEGPIPKPFPPPDPLPPCDCSCYSVFSGAYWSCAFGAGPCCANDAPFPEGPIVAQNKPDTVKNADSRLARAGAKECSSPPAGLGDATVLLTPDRTARLMAIVEANSSQSCNDTEAMASHRYSGRSPQACR